MSALINSPPSVETVCSAISSLYHNPDPKEKEVASHWLNEFQKSVYAWKVSDEILHRKVDVESCYIAAQTMRTKIQSSFHELPKEAHLSLKDSLLEHIENVDDSTSSVIIKQLSLAVADVILLMPEWKGAVQELIQKFGNTRATTLLEILVVLPEEVNSRRIHLGAIRRKELEAEMFNMAEAVCDFLKHCLSADILCPSSQRIHHHQTIILNCLKSWIEIRAIPISDIEQNVIMSLAFQVLASTSATTLPHSLHEAATDCVCSLLYRVEEDCPPGTALELNLFTVIRNLEEPYHMSVANEDTERALNYCRIFTEYGETMLEKIMSLSVERQPHFAISILDSILMCCGHPDYELPDITFNLWYRISEELYQKRGGEPFIALFRPYIERLINALCKHCQMEPDSTDILTEGDFYSFRNRVNELMIDIVFIVGSRQVFRHMLLNNIRRQTTTTWEVLEASLYVMQSVASSLTASSEDSEDVVKEVMDSILNLPPGTHIAVKSTSVKLVGKLGNWIDGNPVYLQSALNFMLQSIHNPKLSNDAANALESICTTCRRHMPPHYEGLLLIIKSVDTLNLNSTGMQGLFRGMAVVTGDLEPPQHVEAAMKTLCWLQADPLNRIIEATATANLNEKPGDPVVYLDRLASILRNVNPKISADQIHPCRPAIQEIWPILAKTFTKYPANVRLMERCCRTVRFAIRCIGTQFAPLVEDLVKLMIGLYEVYPHSCFLYLGSILVDEFAHLPGCVEGLLSMLRDFMTPTYALLQGPDGLRNHPDTVDDFFRLNARFIQRATVPYLQTSFLKSITECAIMSISLDHPAANASVMKFFSSLLYSGRSKEEKTDFETRQNLLSVLRKEYGAKLIDELIKASLFNLPSTAFPDIAEVIYELIIQDRVSVCHWLEASLRALPTVNNNGMQIITRENLVSFHKRVTGASSQREVSNAIKDFYRLWK